MDAKGQERSVNSISDRASPPQRGSRAKISGPLAGIRSLKLKFSIVIVVAVVVTFLLTWLGFGLDWPFLLRPVIAVGLALLMVQVLARGATSPLRDMMVATEAMSHGDYSARVNTASRDEVGSLATAFNAMAAQLGTVEKQRRDLVANVSHELRTPIAALQVNLENLVDGVTEPDEASLGVMLRQTERLGRLVSQLLSLARLEAGAVPLDLTPVSLTQIASRVREEALLTEGSPPVVVDMPADLSVTADAERLHQVFANLVENAQRFSPADRPVTISGTLINDGSKVEVQVTDEGPGIPSDQRIEVFERFHRVDEHRSQAKGGTGLGLAIVKWIVDLHGGSIEATDHQPHGCAMVVWLPVRGPTGASVDGNQDSR